MTETLKNCEICGTYTCTCVVIQESNLRREIMCPNRCALLTQENNRFLCGSCSYSVEGKDMETAIFLIAKEWGECEVITYYEPTT